MSHPRAAQSITVTWERCHSTVQFCFRGKKELNKRPLATSSCRAHFSYRKEVTDEGGEIQCPCIDYFHH
ncbi:hypothetical protein BgiMline_002699 [Biomphalaria glabrata]